MIETRHPTPHPVDRGRALTPCSGPLDHLRVVLQSAPIVLFAFDCAGIITVSDGAGLAAMGRAPGDVVGQSVWDRYADEQAVLENCRRALAGESFTARVTVGGLTFNTRYTPLCEAGVVTGVLGVATDITAQVLAEEERRAVEGKLRCERDLLQTLLDHLPTGDAASDAIGTFGISRDGSALQSAADALTRGAPHDLRTGLPDRTLLRDRLQSTLTSVNRLALCFIDLDRLKDVHDTMGHQAGDPLVQNLGARLQAVIGAHGTAARLAGGELAVLLPHAGEREALAWAEKILAALTEPSDGEGRGCDIGSSMGIALYPDHGEEPAVLMRHADVAMDTARRSGDGYLMYSPALEQSNPARMALSRELRTAIAGDQLVLHYQPQVHLESQCAEHLEALVRWNHPERGFLFPDTFIPVAEESGLIRPLTAWVLNEALRQTSVWNGDGRDIRVSVNLSTRSLHDPELVDTVRDCLERWGVGSANLALEITESAFILDPDRALDTATRLHDLGVRLSIDDFGTGYSSLSYLKRLPIDEVKIDRSFISDVAVNADSAFIVRSVIDLAHNLGIQVVAEGVEDATVLERLSAQDCELVQGFYISRPLTAEAVLPWLAERGH